jgi:hypothetical protein
VRAQQNEVELLEREVAEMDAQEQARSSTRRVVVGYGLQRRQNAEQRTARSSRSSHGKIAAMIENCIC